MDALLDILRSKYDVNMSVLSKSTPHLPPAVLREVHHVLKECTDQLASCTFNASNAQVKEIHDAGNRLAECLVEGSPESVVECAQSFSKIIKRVCSTKKKKQAQRWETLRNYGSFVLAYGGKVLLISAIMYLNAMYIHQDDLAGYGISLLVGFLEERMGKPSNGTNTKNSTPRNTISKYLPMATLGAYELPNNGGVPRPTERRRMVAALSGNWAYFALQFLVKKGVDMKIPQLQFLDVVWASIRLPSNPVELFASSATMGKKIGRFLIEIVTAVISHSDYAKFVMGILGRRFATWMICTPVKLGWKGIAWSSKRAIQSAKTYLKKSPVAQNVASCPLASSLLLPPTPTELKNARQAINASQYIVVIVLRHSVKNAQANTPLAKNLIQATRNVSAARKLRVISAPQRALQRMKLEMPPHSTPPYVALYGPSGNLLKSTKVPSDVKLFLSA